MSGPYKEHSVSLQRDTLSLPWGFRLQGGKDFKAPLTIQRVFVGSPADGVLHRGDILVSIDNHDVTNLFHKQAQDIIKQAGGTLRMRVRRGSSYVSGHQEPAPAPVFATPPGGQFFQGPGPATAAGALAFVPKPRPPVPTYTNVPSFGQDYSKGPRFPKTIPTSGGGVSVGAPSGGPRGMLSKVQRSLNAAIWQPGAYDEDPEYEYRSVHDRTRTFQEPPPPAQYGQSYGQHGSSHKMRSPQAPAQHQQQVQPPSQQQEYQKQASAGAGEDEDEDFSQKSVRDLLGVFTERPQPTRLEVEEYKHTPVKELKKKFGSKPRRSRGANRAPPPPQIDMTRDIQVEEDSRPSGRPTKQWKPPDPGIYGGKPFYEPGWAPKQQKPQAAAQGGWSPVKAPTSPQRFPAPAHHPQPPAAPAPAPYQVPRIEEPDTPAWAGTLKSGGGVKPWEVAAAASVMPENTTSPSPVGGQRGRSPQPAMQRQVAPQPQPQQAQQQQQPASPQPQLQPQEQPRRRQRSPLPDAGQAAAAVHKPRVQNVHYAPGQAPEYQQHAPSQHEGEAKVAHLQYNTPLGLYSRENVQEVLQAQTAGTPGEGTMVVTGGGPPGQKQFDPRQSSVLRMLQEQEGGPRRPADQSARYMEHAAGQEMQYAGYMDHFKQSPSMHALESNMSSMSVQPQEVAGVGGGGGGSGGVGTSDF